MKHWVSLFVYEFHNKHQIQDYMKCEEHLVQTWESNECVCQMCYQHANLLCPNLGSKCEKDVKHFLCTPSIIKTSYTSQQHLYLHFNLIFIITS